MVSSNATLPVKIFRKFLARLVEIADLAASSDQRAPTGGTRGSEEVAMRYIVLIYDDSDESRFVNRFEDAFPQRSLAPARAVSAARGRTTWLSARATWRARASGLEISRLFSIARRPIVQLIAAPILGVPSVYGGYSTMLNFWHGMGVSPSLWLHILAVVAGVASGLAVIARLRT
jgi:hypothetical protein